MKISVLLKSDNPVKTPEDTGILHRIDKDRYGLEPEGSKIYRRHVTRVQGETGLRFIAPPRCFAWYPGEGSDLSGLPAACYHPSSNSVILRKDALPHPSYHAHELGHALQDQHLEAYHGVSHPVVEPDPTTPEFHTEGFARWIKDRLTGPEPHAPVPRRENGMHEAAGRAGKYFFDAIEEKQGKQAVIETAIDPDISSKRAAETILGEVPDSDEEIRMYVDLHLG